MTIIDSQQDGENV